jgi:hypothetical protein
MTDNFPGCVADELGTLTLEVTVGGVQIRLATVTFDARTGLYETYIGLPLRRKQLGRIDSSQERAVCRPRTS